METKLERIAECHKELDGNKAVGIDEITKKKYDQKKSYKPQLPIRIYIPKINGKFRPLEIACYEDKGESIRLEAFNFLEFTFYCGRSCKGMPYIMTEIYARRKRY